MHRQRQPSRQLNYFQQSPVRGQLEPLDPLSRTGWRFLQCTDTPNELRVLLPPRTALIYSHILRSEASELAKDKTASWERIVQIRHLKDRMIRKCQRLARSAIADSPASGPAPKVTYLTIHAPPDFRLKEMERWFRSQGPEYAQMFANSPSMVPSCCSKCGSLSTVLPQTQRRVPQPVRAPERTQRRMPQPVRTPERTQRRVSDIEGAKPIPPPRVSSISRGSLVRREHIASSGSSARRSRSSSVRTSSSSRPEVMSPEPIPIPHRTRESEVIPTLTTSPSELSEEEVETPPPDEGFPFPSTGQPLPTIHEQDGSMRHSLPRRRSSLKKCNSMSRLSIVSQSKSVSWAMDRDWTEQMSLYVKATNEAEVLNHELGEVRVDYHAQVAVMQELCQKVQESSERVRRETEKLLLDEEAVHLQEAKLLASHERLEQKEAQFQEKVFAVLEETRRVVQLCESKRDARDVQ